MKKQKKIKKLNNPRFFPKDFKRPKKLYWIKLQSKFIQEHWPEFIFKQRYRTEKAMQEGLKNFKGKGYNIIETSEDDINFIKENENV